MPDDVLPSLPSVPYQLERLEQLGLAVDIDDSNRLPEAPGALVALRHDAVPAASLAALLTHRGRQGFVVEDLTDLEEFVPTPEVQVPDTAVYLVTGVDRGDEMRDWSPAEAQARLAELGRSPLTVHEGLSWLLQQPDVLADNHCFMTIGSRKPTSGGYDARTPAIWISRGTGRDGRERRHAPKLGWCWWNNRHTWLGFASCSGRSAAGAQQSTVSSGTSPETR